MRYLVLLLALFIATPAYAFDPYEVQVDRQEICLALNMYHESAGESEIGQIAVGFVTLNRVVDPGWRDTICEVVYQRSQFSWTLRPSKIPHKHKALFMKTLVLAKRVIHDINLDPSGGSTYFHAVGTMPCWLPDVDKYVTIDNHVFYRKTSRNTGACL